MPKTRKHLYVFNRAAKNFERRHVKGRNVVASSPTPSALLHEFSEWPEENPCSLDNDSALLLFGAASTSCPEAMTGAEYVLHYRDICLQCYICGSHHRLFFDSKSLCVDQVFKHTPLLAFLTMILLQRLLGLAVRKEIITTSYEGT